jgi:homoserine O-acetyltransferase/O-succinyltransferase
MKFKVIFFAIVLSVCSFSQELLTGNIRNLLLVNGQEIQDCRITYRITGKINETRDNVIVYPTWFGGTSESIIGLAGRLFDTTKYCIIAIDALGNGFSSSPSNSNSQKQQLFPEFSIKDMVNSQYVLLTEVLELKQIHGIIGGSMGGMQVFQWVVSYPDFMKKAVAYVGSPRLTSFDLMLWNTEIMAINSWAENGGDKDELAELITTIHNLLITTPEHKNAQIPRENFDKYLNGIRNNFKKSFEPFNWKSQLIAMSLHDISVNGSLEEAAQKITTDFFIIVGSQDLIVNPAPAIDFAEKYGFKKYVFENNCGHLAPGCEFETFSNMLRNFFDEQALN